MAEIFAESINPKNAPSSVAGISEVNAHPLDDTINVNFSLEMGDNWMVVVPPSVFTLRRSFIESLAQSICFGLGLGGIMVLKSFHSCLFVSFLKVSKSATSNHATPLLEVTRTFPVQ